MKSTLEILKEKKSLMFNFNTYSFLLFLNKDTNKFEVQYFVSDSTNRIKYPHLEIEEINKIKNSLDKSLDVYNQITKNLEYSDKNIKRISNIYNKYISN